MISFLDVVKHETFREEVSSKLAKATQNETYSFTYKFPLLYKYRTLSQYTLNDIINNNVTATSIGKFNDLFDGSMHGYENKKRTEYIENEWKKIEDLQKSTMLQGLVEENYYKKLIAHQVKIENRLSFRKLDYLRTFVCCFSQKNDSILMWSHYASSNSGICIEYDFNNWSHNIPSRHLLYPIAYSDNPLCTNDLFNEFDNNKNDALEKTILCAALNKSNVWSYENEWRLVYIFAFLSEDIERIPVKIHIKPNAIYFGYHFLKQCFYTNRNNAEPCEEYVKTLLSLLNFMYNESIKAYIMIPKYDSFDLFPKQIDVKVLLNFVLENFEDNIESIRYYYTIHDELMDLLEIC